MIYTSNSRNSPSSESNDLKLTKNIFPIFSTIYVICSLSRYNPINDTMKSAVSNLSCRVQRNLSTIVINSVVQML